jgi:hypothetical protein
MNKAAPITGRAAARAAAGAARPLRAPSAAYARQPLKTWQKAALSMLAKKGFDKLLKFGAIEAPPAVSTSAFLKTWKHEEQGRALKMDGPVSLMDCKQAHYRTLEIHFQALAGQVTAKTFERALESEDLDEGRRQAMHHLNATLEEYDLDVKYAQTIARAQYKADLARLDPAQLINLLATIRRRGKTKTQNEKGKP